MSRLVVVSTILTLAAMMIAGHVALPKIPLPVGPNGVAEVVMLVSL